MVNWKGFVKRNAKVLKTVLSVVLVLCLVMPMLPSGIWPVSAAAVTKLNGYGTSNNPYQISTADELLFMAEKVAENKWLSYRSDAYYQLTADIDLTGCTWTPIGTANSPFKGTFLGGGYTVSGLSYRKTKKEESDGVLANYGYFGVTDNAVISGLHVSGTVVNTAQYQVGGLIALAQNGLKLTDCSFTGTVHSGSNNQYSANCGGLVGQITSGSVTIENCTFDGTVTATPSGDTAEYGTQNVGGLVGIISNTANVTITRSQAILEELCCDASGVGGLVGTVFAPAAGTEGTTTLTVSECYTEGKLVVQNKRTVGGLVGWARDSYATEVSDNQCVSITIQDSYSVMDMTDAVGGAGGLLGGTRDPLVTPVFAGDVTISIFNSHFAGKNADHPIMHYDTDLCTVTPSNVYYREDSVKETTTEDMITVGSKETAKNFKNGTVTGSLNGSAAPRWADDSELGYPVLMRQKKPSLSSLTVGGKEVDLTQSVHTMTVDADSDSVEITATSDDSAISFNGNAGKELNNTITQDLPAGQTTTVTVRVTLNGFEKTYTLSIYRNPVPWGGGTESFAVGDGTEGNPYRIATGAQLAYLSNNYENYGNKHYTLTADIDLGGREWTPIASFGGSFDGANHAIRNLNVLGNGDSVGLFGSVSGTVKNLTVSGTVSGANNVGGIAGAATGATFENCDFHGTVSGATNVGGLVGAVTDNTTITKCGSADGNVTGTENIGGLVGSSNGTLTCDNSYSVMTVTGTNTVGGLLGAGQAGDSFSSCHFGGTVSPNTIAPSGTELINVYVVGDPYTAAEFADGTVTNKLGNAVWATSANGYPVPSNMAADVSNAFIANDIAAELAKENPDVKKFATAYSTSIRAKESSQGIRFKFPLSKDLKETVQSVVVLIAKQSDSQGNIKPLLEDEHLYAHGLKKGDEGYYQYLQAKAYTMGSSHNVALVDKTDYYQFAASLVNFKKDRAVYETQYIARAYATFTDAKGQQLVVYSDPIGDKYYYNSVFEVAECHYDPHNAAALELNELVYVKQVYETIYTEVMPEEVLPKGTNSASAFNPQEGGADAKADEMRNDILTYDTDVDASKIVANGGTVYYISPNGDDSNTGTSPDEAWKSVESVNLHADDIKDGDAVLFERGGVYRSILSLKNAPDKTAYVIVAKSGVTYGAYGEGDKPLIYSSYKNYAWGNYWEEVEGAPEGTRIWKINTPYSDAGSVVFDHGVAAGVKRFAYGGKVGEDSDGNYLSYPITKENYLDHLDNDYEYFHDYRNGVLYLRLDAGCPSELYKDIEICTREDIIRVPEKSTNVTIENLALKYSGHYGIAIREYTENVRIQYCEIGWIGGCQWKFGEFTVNGETLGYHERYRVGNAVEFWENTTNATVQHNWVYQVFDAGLSPQGTSITAPVSVYKDISMCNNLVEYCTYNIEFFDRNGKQGANDARPYPSTWDNYVIENNILRFAGYGWGSQRNDPAGKYATAHICGWSFIYDNPLNISIQNNIFDCSAANTVYWWWSEEPESGHQLTISDNTFYEKESADNYAICYGKMDKQTQEFATNQQELKEAIERFDPNPKRVEWLYDDHYIFDADELD